MSVFRAASSSLFAIVLWVSASPIAWSAEPSAADLLPSSTLVYVEVQHPDELLEVLQDHPLRARLEALQGIQAAQSEQWYLDLKAGVAIVEAKLGQTWPNVVRQATVGGLALGVDVETNGVAILAKARDERVFPQLIETLIALAEADAKEKGRSSPVKSASHREIKAYQIGEAKLAAFGSWLLVTNQGDLGKDIIDRFLDATGDGLGQRERFQHARAEAGDTPTAWGYVDIAELRERGVARELFAGRTDNPLAELLVGGMLDTLQETPYLTGSVAIERTHVDLKLALPHEHAWVSEARKYYFGPEGEGAAPAPVAVDNPLLTLTAYRDLSLMWLQAGDLFTDKMVDGLAAADSNLSTLFSGKDFGEDILGATAPEVQLVVTRQTFGDDQPRPAIKLPAFAAIFRLKDPEAMRPEFRRTFQSLIGFLNVVGAMNGQPQLDLNTEKDDSGQLISATYLPDAEATSLTGLKIHYNFGPSVAFVGNRMIVSSTRGLARELTRAVSSAPADVTDSNALVRVHAAAIQAALADNRGQLIAQNMLSEGHTKEEAEQAIDDLLGLVGAFQEASLDLKQTEDRLQLKLLLKLTP